jgi:hypothetical protein
MLPPAQILILSTINAIEPKETAVTDLNDFLITQKWPAQHPDRLQLYSLPTPNGV